MKEKIDMSGQTIGRLHVLSFAGTKSRSAYWNCRCECGREVQVSGHNLRSSTRSCGCLQKELARDARKRDATHGQSFRGSVSPEYRAWVGIVARCTKADSANWHRYGARGIGMCQRWRDSFENFFSDMGPRPSKSHSIDRIDVDGNYAPSNCRWATPKQQARNRRNNKLDDGKVSEIHRLVASGVTHTAVAQSMGVSRSLVGDVIRGRRWKHDLHA